MQRVNYPIHCTLPVSTERWKKIKKNYQFIDVRNLERTKVGTNTINARPKGQSNKV